MELSNAKPLKNLRVLLADDAKVLRRLMEQMLLDKGHRVVTVTDGKKALEQAFSALDSDDPFDVILMDVVMPNLNGCDATYQLRQMGYTGKIIQLTAADREYDLARAFSAGADDFLAKPFTPDELERVLNQVAISKELNALSASQTFAPITEKDVDSAESETESQSI